MNDGDRATDHQADAVYPSDPLGLLERIPELERFLSDRRVRGGIERGRPSDVYRALYWARLRGSFPRDRETLAMLLSKRRLFVAPMNGAPGMQTINGVGTRIYGEAELGQDGAYVGTYYFVFVYIPIFPIASYLMSRAGANAYRFFGRAPFDTFHWLWNRSVVFGVLGSVLAGLMLSLTSSRHGRITVVNGLPFAVSATVCARDDGGGRIIVPPNAHRAVEVAAGDCAFAAFDPAGAELSSGHVVVAGGSHHTVWNVLGQAPLYLEEVVYSSSGDLGADPEIYCGQELIDVSRVHYFLVDPPREISTSRRHGTERRSHFGLASPDDLDCTIERLHADDPQIAAVLERVALGVGHDPELSIDMAGELEAFGHLDAALRVSRAVRERHGGGARRLDVHREYQYLMLHADRRAELLTDYEERRTLRDDADSHYLYLRLVPGPDAVSSWAAASARFPDHPETTLGHAGSLCESGAFEAGALRYDEASRWAQAREVDWLSHRATCLFAAHRGADALLLLDQAFANEEGILVRVLIASQHALLGRAMDPPWESRLMADLPADEGSVWRAVYAGLVGRRPTQDELDAIAQPGVAAQPGIAALTATLLAGADDPEGAFAALAGVPGYLRPLVPPTLELLLLTEAERRSPGSSQPLWRDGHIHPDTPAFMAFVETGTAGEDFLRLHRFARASAYFARSRDPNLDDEARAAALEEAHRLDVLPSWLPVAEEGWPSP